MIESSITHNEHVAAAHNQADEVYDRASRAALTAKQAAYDAVWLADRSSTTGPAYVAADAAYDAAMDAADAAHAAAWIQ